MASPSPTGRAYYTPLARGRARAGQDFGNHLSGVGPLGPEFRVNTTTAGTQSLNGGFRGWGEQNTVAMDGSGNFVVVWEGNGPGDADGIFGQRYTAAGAARGGEF